MADLFSKVSELLSDPSSAEQIRKIASDITDSDGRDLPSLPAGGEGESGTGPDLSALLSGFSSGPHSRHLALLQAVRPYLRSSRAEKIDNAIKAIRVIDLLSALR